MLETRYSKLRENPIGHDSKVVEGYNEKLFRVRVGDYPHQDYL